MRVRNNNIFIERKGKQGDAVGDLEKHGDYDEVQVSVIGKPEAEGTVEVFDGTGKPVYERAFRRSHTLRLSVQPGSYVVRVRDAKSTWTATGKLVVQ